MQGIIMLNRNYKKVLTSGFTLIELVVVVVILGILSIYPIMKSAPLAELTLPSQAQKLASDIRHTQVLASTWGKNLQIKITSGANGTYGVSCASAETSPPCNVSPVIDPVTGSSFNTKLQKDVELAGTSTLIFNSMGQPSTAAILTLCYPDCTTKTNPTKTITVQSLTGYVTVSP